jgi:tetratricopeptide (TPR) repeat protein
MTMKGTGSGRGIHNSLQRGVLVAVSLFAAITFIRPVLSEYYSEGFSPFSAGKLLLASRITPEDARYHYLIGLVKYNAHDGSGAGNAAAEYLRSLKGDPTDGRTWLALARAYRDAGMGDNADFALRKAVFVDKNNLAAVWEAAVFSLGEKRFGEATQLFRRYIRMVPEEQENVYLLYYTMGVEPAYMLANLVPADPKYYSRYLDVVTARKRLSDARLVWEKMSALRPERAEYVKYTNFLIESGEIGEAMMRWTDFAKRFELRGSGLEENRVWNGNFDQPFENGGFDWRIGSSEGVKVFRDRDVRRDGTASLSVSFDGKTNPGISIAHQIVPVEPGKRYRLTAYIKTDMLTTRNGIVLGVSGFRCEPFSIKSEPVSGTVMWRKTEIGFTTPSGCSAVTVDIARERSEKFDNRISGDAWIDSVSLTEVKEK